MKCEDKPKMKRRDFIKILSTGTVAASSAVVAQGRAGLPLGLGSLFEPSEDVKMTMRTDSQGDKISLLGYGGMRWPTTDGKPFSANIDQEKVNGLVDYALTHGVNYFDTAPVYHQGNAENALGVALNRHPRESYHVATKMSNFDSNRWTLDGAKTMYENSFKQLKVEYIDYYLLHNLSPGKDKFVHRFEEGGVLDFLKGEREKGHIRHLGFSFHGNRESFLYALDNTKTKWDFVQVQLNYYDWLQDSDEKPSASYLYKELVKRHIPIVVMEPLLGGRLANFDNRILAKLKKQDAAQSPASWAFRFVGSLPEVLTTLSGMSYMEHLEEDVRIFSPLKRLSTEEQSFLQETAVAMMKYPTIPCTGCHYCMPCPSGLDIPANFAYYNKCLDAGNIPVDKLSANYLKARTAFLQNFSKSVKPKKQSIHCTACGHCLSLCPQHIKIPNEMKRINELVENFKNNTL